MQQMTLLTQDHTYRNMFIYRFYRRRTDLLLEQAGFDDKEREALISKVQMHVEPFFESLTAMHKETPLKQQDCKSAVEDIAEVIKKGEELRKKLHPISPSLHTIRYSDEDLEQLRDLPLESLLFFLNFLVTNGQITQEQLDRYIETQQRL